MAHTCKQALAMYATYKARNCIRCEGDSDMAENCKTWVTCLRDAAKGQASINKLLEGVGFEEGNKAPKPRTKPRMKPRRATAGHHKRKLTGREGQGGKPKRQRPSPASKRASRSTPSLSC